MFRERTTGQVVVMGRKTLESLPGGKPLPARVNIVLSRKKRIRTEGILAVKSAKALFKLLQSYTDKEVYVIGGGEIYRELLPFCDTVYVTKVGCVREADTFFPDLDSDPAWVLSEKTHSSYIQDGMIPWEILVYKRNGPAAADAESSGVRS